SDCLMPKRVFILGGGAALGAHQVGAMKYLAEQGITPDAFVASSIGVLNACCYGSGGIPRLEEAWRDFRSIPRIVSPSFWQNPFLGLSLFSMDRLTAALEEFIDFPELFASPLEMEFVVLNLSRGRGEMHSKHSCADWRELQMGATEIYLLAPIASQLPYKAGFSNFLDFLQRLTDVMWRTIGNMGYLYALMEDDKFHGVPVTVIEPTEQWSGFGPLTVFQAHPAKNRTLM